MAENYEKDINSPGFHRDEYHEQEEACEIVRDVCGGTRVLREKSAEYLPKHEAEEEDEYQLRVLRSVLFNATERTLNALVGLVFRNEPQLGENVPEQIANELTDCDLSGTHWAVFAKELFTHAMRDGHAGVYVDMPQALPDGATLADEMAAGLRPYFVPYSKDQIINWRTDSRGRLSLLVFEEESMEPVGEFGLEKVCRYRVLRPGSWQVYREVEGKRKDEKELILESEGTSPLPMIPFAAAYSRKDAVLCSRPPLLDLALLNIRHFQKLSDLDTYEYVCLRPILWFDKRDKTKPLQSIGPFTYFDVEDGGSVNYAESSGAAIGLSNQMLKELEDKMATMGLSLLVKNNVATTATEEKQDNLKEQSDLATAARSLRDCLELALYFWALYRDRNAQTGGTVEVGAALDDYTLTPQELQAWHQSVAAGVHSRQTVWAIEQNAGKLPQNFDAAAEEIAIETEKQAAMDRASQAFNSGAIV